jgi:predicted MFS family arabinose efflux permease
MSAASGRIRDAGRVGWQVRLFGPPPLSRQVQTHALVGAAEAFFAVSLAGSLFFNVSLDAARPRVILYLALTMAPFAVLAPLIGPVIDRVPGGLRLVMALTCIGRAALCLLLARDLRNLLLYPEAFTVLVLGKSYSIARNAIVPRLVDDPEDLVAANARLARVSMVSSSVGGVLAAGILGAGSAVGVLWVGALVYGAATVTALRLPKVARPPVRTRTEREELHAPRLVLAATAMSVLRGAVGFLLFLVGFALRRAGQPAWFYGVVFVASGLGGLAGTFLAPRLRRRIPEEHMLAAALAVPAAVALVACLSANRPAILAVAVAVGLGGTVGRQSFDSLVQRDAPDAERGRAFARFETRFQLTWVAGALFPVVARPPTWLGLLILGVGLGLGCVTYIGGVRTAARHETHTLAPSPDGFLASDRELPLSVQVLRAGESFLAQRRYRLAVVQAALAVDVFVEQERPPADAALAAARADLAPLRAAASADDSITREAAERSLEIAGRVLSSLATPGRSRPSDRRAARG